MSNKIKKNTVVEFHYVLTGEDQKVIESSRGEAPLIYLHGHNQIVKGLEKALEGKSVGFKSPVTIDPEEGYGTYDDGLVMKLKKSEFKNKKHLKVGSMFQVMSGSGEPAVVRITKVLKDTVVVDGNHPFAGKRLFFDLEVISIRPATKEEIAHGHAHGAGCDHH